MAFAFFLSRSYTAYLKRRVREGECFLSLTERIESMISCYLSPIKDIFSGFECEESAVMDFVRRVRDGARLRDAYFEAEGGLAVGREGKKILAELFSTLGCGYKDGSVGLVASARAEFEKYLGGEREECEKNSRLAAALLLGGALGILLLLI